MICSSRHQTLEDYIATIGDRTRVLEMLVGDTQRIWVYAKSGFAAPQHVGDHVTQSFDRLVRAGYRSRLLTDREGRSQGR